MVKQLSRQAAEEEEDCPSQDESGDRAALSGREGSKKSQLDIRQQCQDAEVAVKKEAAENYNEAFETFWASLQKAHVSRMLNQ